MLEYNDAGSTWYNRKVNVGEGFDTTFTFELSNPSQTCNVMDDVSTYCRSRGKGFVVTAWLLLPLCV